jgi:MSHA biogenesis protein MshP
MSKQHRAQHGFAAIAAIFLVVVLAALGAFMVTFSNTQHLTSTQDLQGTRAYWAARAGLEWGVGAVSAVAGPSSITSATCGSNLSIDGFSVAVSCTVNGGSGTPYVPYVEAGQSRSIVRITAVATLAGAVVGSIGYIERSVSASIER